MNKLAFYLPMPPSVNNLFPTGKHGRRFPSKEYDAWKKSAYRKIIETGILGQSVKGRIGLCITCHFDSKRRNDVANREKAVSDFLVDMKIIRDDCDIDDNRQLRGKNEEHARVLVELWEIK